MTNLVIQSPFPVSEIDGKRVVYRLITDADRWEGLEGTGTFLVYGADDDALDIRIASYWWESGTPKGIELALEQQQANFIRRAPEGSKWDFEVLTCE